jgi:hypothetical protein
VCLDTFPDEIRVGYVRFSNREPFVAPQHPSCLNALLKRRPGMMTLISLGIVVARS